MATTPWYEFWGAYDNTGPYNNVVLGGSPNSTMHFGAKLGTAHNKGYGYGIQFSDDGNYGISFKLNLTGFSVSNGSKYIPNQYYVTWYNANGSIGMYKYKLNVSVSNNGGKSYRSIFNKFIFSHDSRWVLNYMQGWENVSKNSQYNGKFTVPKDTTHVRIELRGEDATFPHYNVFPITKIIEDFRPFAVRKSGKFKTLNVSYGKLQVRKGGSWKQLPKMQTSQVGKENTGIARIRKSGKFVGQGKVGE